MPSAKATEGRLLSLKGGYRRSEQYHDIFKELKEESMRRAMSQEDGSAHTKTLRLGTLALLKKQQGSLQVAGAEEGGEKKIMSKRQPG